MLKFLSKTVDVSEGNMPFIVAVRDDGHFTHIDGQELPFTKTRKNNDTGTRQLALIVRAVSRIHVPFFIFEQVERKRLTSDIRNYFYGRVLEFARSCLAKWGYCYLIDLHAFAEQTDFGAYDIFFGTNHRGTVHGNFDVMLAKQMKSGLFNLTRDLRIYVPGELLIPGERFGATKKSTLVNWLKSNEASANAVQMEVHKSWFMDQPKMVAMALEISDAISSFFTKN